MSTASGLSAKDRLRGLSPAEKRELLARLLAGEAARTRSFPLSFSQQRLWLLDRIDPGNPAYNVARHLRLYGELDVAALERALSEIVRRHEALRTRIAPVEDEPAQLVARAEPLVLDAASLRHLPPAEREHALRELSQAEACRRFDLAHDLMLRVRLVALDAGEHALLLTFHHIAVDGWSIGIFMDELSASYAAYRAGREPVLPELSIQYADFATWQRERAENPADLAYWRAHLAGVPPVLRLPASRPRPAAPTFAGATAVAMLPPGIAGDLEALARAAGATTFMLLLAAFEALLVRYGCAPDIVLGTPIAGRSRPEVERLIGFFVNTLPLRTDCSGDPPFSELLARVKETTLGAFDHQDVPFERIVEVARPPRLPGVNPLVQMLFVMQSASRGLPPLEGLRLERIDVDNGTAKFDISLSITPETSGYELRCEYSRELFDEGAIALLLADYRTVLATVAAAPETRLSALRVNLGSASLSGPVASLPSIPAQGSEARPRPDESRPPRDSLEQAIAEIWSRLLGRKSVGRDDDFFELGGHSLLAARMVAEVERICGSHIQWATLIESPTIAHVADILRRAGQATSPIAAFNESGKRARLFFFHSDPFTGGVYCRRLAEELGPEQPFYAIAPHGIDGVPMHPTIEAMAADYAERIAAIQPRGPYRLGGFCAGGLVAYELACLLQARGESVERVILINTAAPSPYSTPLVARFVRAIGLDVRLDPGLRERLCRFAVGLRAAAVLGAPGLSRFIRRLARARTAPAPGTFDAFTDTVVVKQKGTPVVETSLAHIVAAYTYRPRPYDGPLALIWGVDQRAATADPTIGWGALARTVRVMRMPGGHLSLLRDGIGEVARGVSGILAV